MFFAPFALAWLIAEKVPLRLWVLPLRRPMRRCCFRPCSPAGRRPISPPSICARPIIPRRSAGTRRTSGRWSRSCRGRAAQDFVRLAFAAAGLAGLALRARGGAAPARRADSGAGRSDLGADHAGPAAADARALLLPRRRPRLRLRRLPPRLAEPPDPARGPGGLGDGARGLSRAATKPGSTPAPWPRWRARRARSSCWPRASAAGTVTGDSYR